MVIKNILSELCVSSGSSFGTNAIVLAFIQLAVVRVVSAAFAPYRVRPFEFVLSYFRYEIKNGEKP